MSLKEVTDSPRLRPLGRTGLQVGELSLGAALLGSWGASFEDACKVIHRALDVGINYIDTAPMYADSEEVLGKALGKRSKDIIISTKVGHEPQPFDPKDKKLLRSRFEQSLRFLKRDYIDILMIHEADRRKQFDWWDNWETCDGPVMELIDDLKREGKVRFAGLGGTTAYEMARVIQTGKFDVVLAAFNYSLLWREAKHEIIPAAVANKLGVVIGSPLHQGALARRYDVEKIDWISAPRRQQYLALYEFLDSVAMPLPELCLRFVLSNPYISTVLTGARSISELEQNVASATKGPLSSDILSELDGIAAMVPFRPFDEPFILPFNREYAGAGKASR